MSELIQTLERAQLERQLANKANGRIPTFSPGDTVAVYTRVREGQRERLQNFEGMVIARRNRGLNSSFTVRKISYGEGVERVFQTYSPLLKSIEIKRRGRVRRAKLYYLRTRRGKAARIAEKIRPSAGDQAKK